MKKYLHILLCILTLFALSIASTHYTLPEHEEEKTEALKQCVKTIHSINPTDTLFDDLSFLKEKLKNIEVVMLGEQTHFDGATFLAKARLIKYLHRELGFDVLVYEAGLYDMDRVWQELRNKPSKNISDFSKALYSFWYEHKENEDLLNYVLKNAGTEHELELAGLDVQFSGMIEKQEREAALSRYLASRIPNDSLCFPSFFALKKDYAYFASKWSVYGYPDSRKDSILRDIQSIRKLLSQNTQQSREDSLYIRFFQNMETLYGYAWKYDIGSDIRFHVRDSAMADNFIWLKEHRFDTRKVIVWAANMHTAYMNSYGDFTTMGEWIKKKYGDKVYSIQFTSYAHARNLSDSEKIYSNKTVEYLLHQLNAPYLYLDFDDTDSSSFLRGEIVMNCNQEMNLHAPWSKVADAVFYIDRMTGLTQ